MQTSIRSFRRTTALILAGSIAALLVPRLSAQTTVTYTSGQTDSTARSTTAPNDPTTLTIASGSATQSGVLSGTGAIIKDGSGTLTFSNTNSYAGATTVNGGVLVLQTNAIAVVNSSSGFFINNASTLRVSGNRMDFIGKTFTFGSSGGGTLDAVATGFGGFVFKGDNTFKTTGGARSFITGAGAGQGFNMDIGYTAIFDVATGSDSSSDLTVSAVLSNAGGVSKTGSGRLTLSGANTYKGATTVNGGGVSISEDANLGTAPVFGAANLIFDGGTLLTTATFTLGRTRSIVMKGDGAFDVTTGTTLTVDGGIFSNGFFSGSLAKNGGGTLVLTNKNRYGDFNTVQTTINAGTLQVGDGAHNDVQLAANMTANQVNVKNGTTLDVRLTNTGNTFNNNIATTGNGAVISTTAAGVTQIFGGTISGPGTFSVNGLAGATTGVTILSGANTYTGGTTVSQGTLVLNNNAAAGGFAAGTITLGNGSTGNSNVELQFGSGISGSDLTLRPSNGVGVRRVNPITVANTGSSGTATLAFKESAGTFIYSDLTLNRATVFASDSSTRGQRVYMGQISGAGAGAGNDTVIIDSGAGNWLTMYPKDTGATSLANTFSGNLRVKSGNLEVGNLSYISDVAANSNLVIPDTASVTVDTGATLIFVWGDETFDALNGGGTISRNTGDSQGTRTLTIGASGGSGNFSGSISASGGFLPAFNITKTGSGTQTLSGANTYTGVTTVSAGVLNIQNGSALGTVAAGTSVTSGAALQIQGGITTLAEALTLNGTGISADGALRNISGDNNYAGLITLGSATRINSDAGTLTLSNAGTITGATLGLTVGGAGNTTINSIIGTTTGALTKDGAGTLTLSGANTYTGTTTINGGTLSLLGGNAIADGPASGRVVLANVAGATLNLQTSETIGSFEGGGALGGNTTLNGNTLTTGNNASTTYSGSISGTGGLTKVRAATNFTLAGVNTYTGPTNINAGTITLNGGDAILDPTVANPTAGAVIVAAGGTLALTAPETIGTLSGPAAGSNANLNNSKLTLGVAGIAGGDTTFAGTITDLGGGSIVKNSADAFTLSGNTSTYAAGTTLNAGTLNINNSSTAGLASGPLGTGALNINAGTIGTTTNGGGTNFNTIANAVNLNADFSVSNVVGAGNLVNPLNGGLVTDGVTFSGPVSINQPNITINTVGGYLDFTGVINENAPGNGLTFTGNTFTQIGAGGAGDAANTYTGATNLQSGGLLLNKGAAVAGADGLAIPGNLNISPGTVVQVLSRTLNASVANNQISPSATVTVNGTLDLGGTNQTINSLAGAGTIRLDDSVVNVQWGGTFAGPTALMGAGTLTVNSGSFTGAIVDAGVAPGRGQVVKNTAGTLNLFGASSYTGGTTLNAGTLGVGHANALGSGNLTINGGTLRTVGGPLVLNLGGGNIQGNGGTVVFNVGGTVAGSLHDQLVTTGAAALNGTTLALVQQNGFLLQIGEQVTLISAAAGVAGGTATGTAVAAGSVSGLEAFSNNPLLVPAVNLYTSSVVLEATQGSFLALSSRLNLTGNQLAVARVLDGVAASIGKKTGIYQELTFLSTQPLSTLQSNLDKLVPEELVAIFSGSITLAQLHATNLLRGMENLRDRNTVVSASAMSAAGSGPSYSGGMNAPAGKRSKEILPPSNDRWGMFLTGSGEWTRVGSTTNAAGYNMETGGVTVGVDYRVTTNFAVGLDLGYVGTSTSLVNGGKISTDGGRLGVFATYFDQNFHVDAAVTGGLNSYKTKRTTPNNTAATGRPDGSEINVLVAAGYDWKFGGLTVGPTASYQYTNVQMDGFRETGTFAPLNVRSQSAESSRTAFGIRAYYDAKVRGVAIRPELKLAWQHEFGDNGFSITSNFATLGGNAFTVNGATTGRDAMLIGAGVSILWTDRVATYLYYDGEVGRTNYESHGVSGGVRIQF